MRNKELKQEFNNYEQEVMKGNILAIDQYEKLKRYLEINDIVAIFSEIIETRFTPNNLIITITNKPLKYSYIQVAYDMDGYRIEWRNDQKLHIIGLSHKDFKTIKNKYEAKNI